MPRKPAPVTHATRLRAKTPVGPVQRAELVCLGCGEECRAEWCQPPPEVFRCPSCGRRRAIRADSDDVPYPLPPDALPM